MVPEDTLVLAPLFLTPKNLKTMRNFRIINLTPHPVVIHTNLGYPGRHGHLRIDPEPSPLRAVGHTRVMEKILVDGEVINITFTNYSLEELPPVMPNTLYIVSRIIAEKFSGIRNDLVIPTGLVKDENNRVIGCKSLAKI